MEKRETTQDGQKSKKKVKQESVSMVKNEQMNNDCNFKGSHAITPGRFVEILCRHEVFLSS